MNSSFAIPIPPGFARNLQSARAWLFALTLAASAFAIAAAVAIRAAAPASRLDLWLFLVALICGAVAAVTATKQRRTLLFRRTLGSVFAIGVVAYSVLSALHPPEIISAHELVYVRWFPPKPIQEEPIAYVFCETSNGKFGAMLPSGQGWTIDPPTETSLQAFGDGLRVRVERATVLPGEDPNDVAERSSKTSSSGSPGISSLKNRMEGALQSMIALSRGRQIRIALKSPGRSAISWEQISWFDALLFSSLSVPS